MFPNILKFFLPILKSVHFKIVDIIYFLNLTEEIIKRLLLYEALESVMCDVIKIRLKRSISTRSGKGNQPLIIKTAIERPILVRITKF